MMTPASPWIGSTRKATVFDEVVPDARQFDVDELPGRTPIFVWQSLLRHPEADGPGLVAVRQYRWRLATGAGGL
jgi:hypothetical protein